MVACGGVGGGGQQHQITVFTARTHIPFSNRLDTSTFRGPPLAQRTALRSPSAVRERDIAASCIAEASRLSSPKHQTCKLGTSCPQGPALHVTHCMSLRGMTAPVTPVKAEVELTPTAGSLVKLKVFILKVSCNQQGFFVGSPPSFSLPHIIVIIIIIKYLCLLEQDAVIELVDCCLSLIFKIN